MGILRTDRVSGLGGANAIKGSVEFRAAQNIQAEIVNSNADFNYGSGDFTIECWIYETTTNTDRSVWDGRNAPYPSDSNGFTLTRISSNAFRIWLGSALITTGSVTIQNSWVHTAFVRYSGTINLFINGISAGTASNSSNFSSSADFRIGAGRYTGTSADAFITGYIQDFRITSGLARYTTNFTPPTASFEG